MTIYYIASGGSDSNNGTSTGTPWQTVGKVNGVTPSPGDQYLFNGGDTFTDDTLIPPLSGTQAAPIIYGSYGSGRAIIAPSGDGWGIYLLDVEFITVEDLNVTGPGFTGSVPSKSTTSTYAGVQVLSLQQGSTRLCGITLNNLTVSGFYSGILVLTRSGVGNQTSVYYIRNGTASTSAVVGFDNIRLTNCIVNEAAMNGILFLGGYSVSHGGVGWDEVHDTFKGIYIGDCQVYNVYGNPSISNAAPNVLAVINTSGALIERTVVHDCGQCVGGGTASVGTASFLIGNSRNITIQWSEVYNTVTFASDGTGFDLDQDSQDCIVQFCFAHGNDGSGFIAVQGGYGTNQNNVFRYNVSYNDSHINYGSLYDYGGTNNVWMNNTVYLNRGSAANLPGCIGFNASSNALVLNNVFITTGNLSIVLGTVTTGIAFFAGNLYWPSGGTLDIAGHSTLSSWQGIGQETLADGLVYGIVADPLLNGQGSFGSGAFTPVLPTNQLDTMTAFQLTALSPARGAGVDVTLLGVTPSPMDAAGGQT